MTLFASFNLFGVFRRFVTQFSVEFRIGLLRGRVGSVAAETYWRPGAHGLMAEAFPLSICGHAIQLYSVADVDGLVAEEFAVNAGNRAI